MRSFRLFVGLTIIGAQIAAVATGCSDDEKKAGPATEADASGGDGSTNPGNDASGGGDAKSDGTTTTDAAEAPTVTVTAGDVNVYLGQIAQLDASGSTVTPQQALGYQWTLVSAPPGSAIVTSSIFNAGSARPSFTPDVVGDYTLKVVVSAGTTTQEKNVVVKAVEAQALYLYTDGDGGTIGRSGIRAAATITDAGTKDLSCHVTDAGSASAENNGVYASLYGSDIWEGPPGTPPRVAYVQAERYADATQPYVLYAVNGASTCATPPTKLDEQTADYLMQPSFSPNGNRIAYIKRMASGDRVMAVGFDGADRREVGAFAARADGGLQPDASVALLNQNVMALSWLSDTKVGWLQITSGNTWQIAVGDDAASGAADVYMKCASIVSGDKPTQFAFTADGSVLVIQRVKVGDSATNGARDLLVYKPNATTKQCELVRNITNHESDGGTTPPVNSVSAFSVSPDGTLVAYVDFDRDFDAGPGFSAHSIWTAAIDGTTPPAPLPGAPTRGVVSTHGPRWAAGGSLLVWPQLQNSIGAGDAGNKQTIVVASSGGGTPRIVANSSPASSSTKNVFAIGNGAACNVAAAGGSGLMAVGAIGAFVSLLVRRGRKNRK